MEPVDLASLPSADMDPFVGMDALWLATREALEPLVLTVPGVHVLGEVKVGLDTGALLVTGVWLVCGRVGALGVFATEPLGLGVSTILYPPFKLGSNMALLMSCSFFSMPS